MSKSNCACRFEKVDKAAQEAIDIADRALTWAEHKDFNRVYVALQKVYAVLNEGRR